MKEIALKLLLIGFAVGLCSTFLFSGTGLKGDASTIKSTTESKLTTANSNVLTN